LNNTILESIVGTHQLCNVGCFQCSQSLAFIPQARLLPPPLHPNHDNSTRIPIRCSRERCIWRPTPQRLTGQDGSRQCPSLNLGQRFLHLRTCSMEVRRCERYQQQCAIPRRGRPKLSPRRIILGCRKSGFENRSQRGVSGHGELHGAGGKKNFLPPSPLEMGLGQPKIERGR